MTTKTEALRKAHAVLRRMVSDKPDLPEALRAVEEALGPEHEDTCMCVDCVPAARHPLYQSLLDGPRNSRLNAFGGQ